MADFSENKQKRLMSLNQDVLAVSSGQQAPEYRQPPTRPSSERFTSSAQQSVPSSGATVSSAVLIGLSVMACAALLVAAVSIIFVLDSQQQIKQLTEQAGRPDAMVASLSERIVALETRLDAAGQDTDKMDAASQSSLLQINSRIRKVAMDSSRVNAEFEQLKKTLQGSGAAEALVAKQASRLNALENRVAALASKPVTAPAPTAASPKPLSAEQWEQQLVQLNIRMEKQASEIKAIYRLLEAQ
jgi:ribosomal protein S15P/S13E